MSIRNLVIGSGAAIAVLTILGTAVIATADDKAAGEMWHQTMSMEMPGMTMPPHTMDVCLPAGKARESLSKPQGPGVGANCSVQDAKREGNKYTAKFSCSGKQPVQGTIENIFEGDHSKVTMILSMNGLQMTMKTDAQKVGTPCTPGSVPGAK
ncbi:MAG TPA: DUF3617 family protein [Steroidobacteraceae bacterium]|jgi:hypothetical protein|nr:DUF3617 family protein [Steroidobacteraceae bacterium]